MKNLVLMDPVQRFKQVRKALLGTKLWNWLSNTAQVGSIAENPSVMTASGWRVDRGKVKQNKLNNKEVKLLRGNLATIGEAAITAPTVIGDLGALYNAVKHPVLTGKAIGRIPSDIKFFLKERTPLKIYHGSRKIFPLTQARTASPSNFGLHVTPNKEIAEHFGNLQSGYISSKSNMKLIDNNGGIDYSIFPNITFTKDRGYLNFGNNTLRYNLIKKYGGNPFIREDHIYLTKDVKIPMTEFWKNSNKIPKINPAKSALEATKNNLKVASILSNNGQKIIEYNNAVEYPGGISYIITDPKVIHQPENWIKPLSLFKYVGYNLKN